MCSQRICSSRSRNFERFYSGPEHPWPSHLHNTMHCSSSSRISSDCLFSTSARQGIRISLETPLNHLQTQQHEVSLRDYHISLPFFFAFGPVLLFVAGLFWELTLAKEPTLTPETPNEHHKFPLFMSSEYISFVFYEFSSHRSFLDPI